MENPPKGTLLIVEDERIVAKDLQRTLIGLGYRVPATAANGADALRLAAEHCPDLALMDIRIKGEQDGVDTARLLRERFDIPIIFLTAYADDPTVERAKEIEPYGYLLKPIKSEELRSAVEIALYKHAMDRKLRQRERWFSTTLRSIGDAVISIDECGQVNFMNPVAEHLTGWRLEDATGKPFAEIVRLLDVQSRQVQENPLRVALQEGRVLHMDASLVPKEGSARTISDSAAPIVNQAGDIVGAVMVFRDVSEQRRLQQRLELADRLASLGTMAAGVAHEINNPLAFLVGNLQFTMSELRARADSLHDAPWVRSLVEALEDSLAGAERVKRIVADLRTFARPDQSSAGRADANEAVRWAVKLMRHELDARARLVLQLGEVPLIAADEARLGQVILNLLSNAVYAVQTQPIEKNEITITTQHGVGGRVVVVVHDTGVGIPKESLGRIFEPFFTTKGVGKGIGLGLSICHGIVTALGGEITVESRVGVGSTFRLSLPAAPPEIEEAPQRPEVREALVPRGRLLLIDDTPMLLTALERGLASAHELSSTLSGRHALSLLEGGRRYDLILCDVMMPDFSGIDFYEALLRVAPDQARRVVFLTGGAFTTRALEFLQSVENPIIEKPFSLVELRSQIGELLLGWGLYDAA